MRKEILEAYNKWELGNCYTRALRYRDTMSLK
jgi:hypothetical protein